MVHMSKTSNLAIRKVKILLSCATQSYIHTYIMCILLSAEPNYFALQLFPYMKRPVNEPSSHHILTPS